MTSPFDSSDRLRRDARTASVPPRVGDRPNPTNDVVDPLETARSFREFRRELRQSGVDAEKEIALSDDAGNLGGGRRATSWLLSVATHIVLTIILALIILPGGNPAPEVEAVFSEQLGDQLETLTDDEGNLNPNDAENYELTVPEEFKIDETIIAEKENLPFVQDVAAPLFEQSRIEMSEILDGRTDPGTKNDLLAKYGGNKTTRDAVAAGLLWLKKRQQKDGSWSLRGPFADGVSTNLPDNTVAATAFALLAFQGDGSTRETGEYSAVVRRGWNWLLKQQQKNGCFRPEGTIHSNSLFYAHAMTTIALCELLALEKKSNASLRKQAQLAVDFLIDNQNDLLGGWKYEPGEGSDLSVTGWCLMALQTARIAKINVPESNLNRVSAFLDSVSFDDGARYAYQVDAKGKLQQKTASMTAAGLMCREYLGWAQNDPMLLRGADYLSSPENLIRFPESVRTAESATDADSESDDGVKEPDVNVYGWYATSTTLKQLGPYNQYWRRWNAAMCRELPKRQEPSDSKEAGSWSPKDDIYGFSGGRLYVTTLSILCLEVYYRYLSLYTADR